MFVKICGIRDVAAALAVAQAGADAIGLNFYARSPRVVAPAVAAEIVTRLRQQSGSTVEAVGVFVNHAADEIRTICRQCDLRTVQLHGDEPPELVAELAAEFSVVRAFRVGDDGLEGLARHLDACNRLCAKLWACLIDAKVEGMYGGTGHAVPWEMLRRAYRTAAWPPLILAGGLRPDTVAAAIRIVQPWGVDVAGGVESSLACKDAALVRQFVQNARTST
jgi:phosphoribosylanthranilate isomerase